MTNTKPTMSLRDITTKAIASFQDVADNLDEFAALEAREKQLKDSLASLAAAHKATEVELEESKAQLAQAQADHADRLAAIEAGTRNAGARLASLIDQCEAKAAEVDALGKAHQQILDSMQSLRAQLGQSAA